jgi:hypothetical protein
MVSQKIKQEVRNAASGRASSSARQGAATADCVGAPDRGRALSTVREAQYGMAANV